MSIDNPLNPLNLSNGTYFIKTSDTQNPYLGIRGLNDVVGLGVYSFLLDGSQFLQKGTDVKFEIKDSNDNIVSISGVRNIIKGTSRVISFEITDDVPNGTATLYIATQLNSFDEGGIIEDIPSNFIGIDNFLFEYRFQVDKTRPNTDEIIFRKPPQLTVTPTIKTVRNITKTNNTTSSINATVDDYFYSEEQFSYTLFVTAPSSTFSFDMDGGIASISNSLGLNLKGLVNIVDGSRAYITVKNPDIQRYTKGEFRGILSSPITFTISFNTIPDISNTRLQESAIADIQITDMGVVSGDVAKIRIYGKSDALNTNYTLLSEVDVDYKNLLEVEGTGSVGIFNSSDKVGAWNITKEQATATNPSVAINNDIFLSGLVINGDYGSPTTVDINGRTLQTPRYVLESDIDITLKKNIDYSLRLNSAVTNVSSTDTRLDVYIKGTGFSTDNKFGKLIHSFRADSSRTWRDEFSIIFSIDGDTTNAELVFVTTSGRWYIHNLNLTANIQQGFSPQEFRTEIPILITKPNQDIDFKIEFFDPNNNKAQTVLTEDNVLFERPNIVVEGQKNVTVGEMYLGQNSGSGVVQGSSGNGGIVKSFGYEGFNESIGNDGIAGFLMFSGSVLTGSTNSYEGVGLELVASSESFFRYRTNPSILDIRTDSFFIGQESSQFISGADSNIEISSSQFHLDPKNDLLIIGSDAVINADLTVNNIRTPATIGGSPSTTANASSSIDSDGFAKFVSASIGGFDVLETQINSTNNNLVLKSNGQITGSTVLFDGGTIGGFELSGDGIGGDGYLISGSATGNDFFISASNFNVKANGDVTGSRVLFTGGTISGSDITFDVTQFVAKGDTVEISGSNFHLLQGNITASNVDLSGTITATAGEIGGFSISQDSLSSGTNFFLSGSATGNDFFISSSKFNVKANGDVTGSQVLFTGGKITGSNITFDVENFTAKGDSVEISGSNFHLLEGNITASNVDLTGNISANTGNIGNFQIIDGKISGSNITLDANNSTIFKTDQGPGSDPQAVGFEYLANEYYIDFTPTEENPDNFFVKFGPNFMVDRDGILIASGAEFQGTITASAGTLGGFTIGSSSIFSAANSIFISGSPLVGGVDSTPYMFISTSNFNVKQNGDVTGSNVLFTGGKITGSNITFDVTEFIAKGDTVEISGSNFHLLEGNITASNVDLSGTITANAGEIGGFTISQDALSSGNNFFLSGSATGNNFFISSSKFNVKANGDVTGSNVLFTGGKISGSGITFDVTEFVAKGDNVEISGSNFHLLEGNITASNVDLSGTITATAGEIGGFVIESDEIRDTGNNLRLKSVGQITGSQVSFTGGDIGGFVLESDEIRDSGNNLRLKSSGEITGSQVLFTGGTVGGFTITDTLITASNLEISSDGTIQTPNFADGVRGFQITAAGNGSAQFENIKIRGTLRTTVFEKETVNAVGGQLWVANSTALSQSVTSGETTMSVENVTGFEVGEILLIKKVDGTGFNSEYVLIESSSRTDGSSDTNFTGKINVTRGYSSGLATGSDVTWVSEIASTAQDYSDGQVLVSTGKQDTGWILLNASPNNTYTPYIDIVERTGSGVYDYELKARLGDLSGLSSTQLLGNSPTTAGFGLFSENVFLQGGITATYGSIGGFSITDTAISSSNDNLILRSNGQITGSAFLLGDSSKTSNYIEYDGGNLVVNGTINIIGGDLAGIDADTISGSFNEVSQSIDSTITTNSSSIATDLTNTSSSIDNTITSVSSSLSSSLSDVSSSAASDISTNSGDITTNAGNITTNSNKIVTDANAKIVKPIPTPSAGAGLYLTSTAMGFYDNSSFNAFISSSGDFLFKKDDDNQVSFGNNSFILKVSDQATISGSNINLLTPTFFFGTDEPGQVNFISGSNGNLEISSSNFVIDNNGNVTVSGDITITAGDLAGIDANTISGSFNDVSESIDNSITSVSSSLSSSLSEVSSSLSSSLGDVSSSAASDIATNSTSITTNSDKIVTDANAKIVKPIVTPSSTGLFLTAQHLGYYSTTDDWNAYISSSGEFLFKADDNNLVSFASDGFVLKTETATISGSAVNLLTPTFFFGTDTPGSVNYISGSNNNLEISSSNFELNRDGSVRVSGQITITSGDLAGVDANTISGSFNDVSSSIATDVSATDATVTEYETQVVLDTNGMSLKNGDGTITLASYGTTTTIGQDANDQSRIFIDSDSVDLIVDTGGTDVVEASFGATTTIGGTSGQHVSIDNDSFDVKTNATTTIASFGATTTIGTASAQHVSIDSDSFDIKTNATTTVATFGTNTTLTGGTITLRNSTNNNDKVQIGENYFRVFDNNVEVAEFGATTTIGTTTTEHVEITSTGLKLKDGGTERLVMDENGLRIGTEVTISSTGDATFGGTLSAPDGNIGGFTLGDGVLSSGNTFFISGSATGDDFFISSSNFQVSANGDITSSNILLEDAATADAFVFNLLKITGTNEDTYLKPHASATVYVLDLSGVTAQAAQFVRFESSITFTPTITHIVPPRNASANFGFRVILEHGGGDFLLKDNGGGAPTLDSPFVLNYDGVDTTVDSKHSINADDEDAFLNNGGTYTPIAGERIDLIKSANDYKIQSSNAPRQFRTDKLAVGDYNNPENIVHVAHSNSSGNNGIIISRNYLAPGDAVTNDFLGGIGFTTNRGGTSLTFPTHTTGSSAFISAYASENFNFVSPSNKGGYLELGVHDKSTNNPITILKIEDDGVTVTGNLSATGEVTAYASDERLKTIHGNIENPLDKIDKLNGFYYNWNETANKLGIKHTERKVGVSAQQVQKVLPEITPPAPIDENYLTVQYDKLVPLLIEGIKELRNENKELKQELSNIKKQMK